MTETKTEKTTERELTADDILAADDLELLEVKVPEWGGKFWLRVFPADEGLALNDRMQALPKEKAGEAVFEILAACIVNSKGERLFKSPNQLRSRSQKVLLRIQRQALALQGWSQEAPAKNV